MMRNVSLGLLCSIVAACGPAVDHEDETDAVLTIAPAAIELLIVNGVPANQDYTATLTFSDGFQKDVTAETLFSVDATFGSFTGSKVAIGTAGKTTAFGQRNDKTAMGTITAYLESTRVDPSLPPDVPDLFASLPEDPSRAPTVVYPAPDVIVPRNLGDFETHWIDGNGNNVFEISLTTEFADVRVYVPGGNGDPAAGPMASFSAFLASEWLSVAGLEPNVRYQVRGLDTNNPTSVGAGQPRTVELSNERLEGGIYYWAAASINGPEGIYRHDMNKPGQQAEEFYTTNQTPLNSNNEHRCVACHVLSRDGTKMAVTYDGGNGLGTMVDVATIAPQTDSAAWNFATFTPDGSQFLAVHQGTLTVRSSADQSALIAMPSDGLVSHPDLSPDGTRLVYIRRPTSAESDWAFTGGQIFTRTYDQTSLMFGPEVPLVTTGGNHFYPSWSPDGQWILFNRSADNGDAYDNPNAALFVVKADGGEPIELAAANIGLGLTNSWGRWAPFQQTIGIANEPMFWVTVSSKRNFGVRLVNANRPQIWMTPFFPGNAALAADPSVASFRLPFQNIDSNNHIAQWTERVVTTQ